MKITLSAARLGDIEQQALRALPDEACGLVVGWPEAGGDGKGNIVVTEIHPSKNLAAGDSRGSFEIDPALHMRLQRDLRGSGEEIIGVYHSHPQGAAEPSEADAGAAAYPGWVWLITACVAGDAPVTRAFRHDPGGGTDSGGAIFTPLEIAIAAAAN